MNQPQIRWPLPSDATFMEEAQLHNPVCMWADKWCFHNEAHRYIDVMEGKYKVIEYDPNQHKEANHCEW